MKKQQVLDLLHIHQERIHGFAVKSLFIFGSVARDEATPDSDVDLLVEFEHPVGLFTLLSLKGFLEELFDCSVDLGTPNSLRPHLRETVLGEAIRAI